MTNDIFGSEQPLVSVIVPAYNVEKYISECIESIIAQTHYNLEIIIIDDETPDNSGKIADEFAAIDSRIRVIHQKNKGVSAARNHGLDEAHGKYIVFVDPDDWISTDHISYLLQLQKQTGADMCLTTEFYTKKGDRQSESTTVNKLSPAEATALLLSPKVVVGCYNKLYKREVLEKNCLRFNESLFSGEGLNFITTATQYANFVAVGNRKIYYYRRNVSESATTKFNIKMFTNNELSLDLIKKNLIVKSKTIDTMLDLFRVHLCISGLLAVFQNASVRQYPAECKRWVKLMRTTGVKMVFLPDVPLKSKIRIVAANICPRLWSWLAKTKRHMIFKESV